MCVKSDKVEMNYAKDNGDGTYSNATTEIPSVTGIMTSFNRVGYTWAGGNYNMITGLLRNEWGFHGFIITDNANTGVFMDAGQMIQAGADGKLTNLPTGARYTFNKDDVSDYHYGREAVHNILYTIANSKAMNGGMPGSRYLAKVEPYQKVIYAVDGVCGGLIALAAIIILGYIVIKELFFTPGKKTVQKQNFSVLFTASGIFFALLLVFWIAAILTSPRRAAQIFSPGMFSGSILSPLSILPQAVQLPLSFFSFLAMAHTFSLYAKDKPSVVVSVLLSPF